MTNQLKNFFAKTKSGLIALSIVFVSIICLTGCITSIGRLNGKIHEGRYYSDGDLFSIDVPQLASAGYIIDRFGKENANEGMNGGVAFANQYGYYLKIEVLDPLLPVLSAIAEEPKNKVEVLDMLFYKWVLPEMKKKALQIEVFEKKHIVLENGEPALFAIFGLPKETVEFNDAYFKGIVENSGCLRGILLTFAKNNYLVFCEIKDMVSLFVEYGGINLESSKQRIQNDLLQAISSFSSNAKLPNRVCEVDAEPI